jgi:hypothetical protein
VLPAPQVKVISKLEIAATNSANAARCASSVICQARRDAANVPISNTFGLNTLTSFKVWTEEVSGGFP